MSADSSTAPPHVVRLLRPSHAPEILSKLFAHGPTNLRYEATGAESSLLKAHEGFGIVRRCDGSRDGVVPRVPLKGEGGTSFVFNVRDDGIGVTMQDAWWEEDSGHEYVSGATSWLPVAVVILATVGFIVGCDLLGAAS